MILKLWVTYGTVSQGKKKKKNRPRKRFVIYERYSLPRTFYTYRLNIYLHYRSFILPLQN